MKTNTQEQDSEASFGVSEITWPEFADNWSIPIGVPLSKFIDRVQDLADCGYGYRVDDYGYHRYRITCLTAYYDIFSRALDLAIEELVKLVDLGKKETSCLLNLFSGDWREYANKHKLPSDLTFTNYVQLMFKLAAARGDIRVIVSESDDSLECRWHPTPTVSANRLLSDLNADIVMLHKGRSPATASNTSGCDAGSVTGNGYPIDSSKTVVVSLPSTAAKDQPTAVTSSNTNITKEKKGTNNNMTSTKETNNISGQTSTCESVTDRLDKAKSRAGRLAKEAGHRIAVRQGAKTAKAVITSVLPEQQRASFQSATDTTIGDAAFRGLLAMIVPTLPGIRDEAKERISDELFVGAMQDVGTEAFEKVTGPLVQALVQIYGRGILTEPAAASRSGLESGNC